MPVQKTYTVEILNPSSIESEVPKQQTLRQAPQDVGAKVADDFNKMADEDGAKREDDSFVPVFSSKKEEAVFTKGDLKLQKIQHLPNPIYSEVNGEVIDTQPIRIPRSASNGDNKLGVRDENDKNDDDDETSEEKKPKSRIPKMRLRLAAADMVRERRKSASKDITEEAPTAQPRRSSIPRRRRQSYKSPPPPKRESDNENTQNDSTTSEDIEKTTDVVVKTDEEAMSPEEFDKLYDEIIHTDESLPFIDTNLQLLPIDNNLEDPVSLENTFEEMMHDYEENKAEPIDVNDIKSKIPLLKQKSLPEGEFIRRIDRRRSLKDTPIDGVKVEDERKSKVSKLNDLKNKYDRNAKEDLKEHKRLTKEILKREEAEKKQLKDGKSKFFKGKCDFTESNNTKSEVVKKTIAKPSVKEVVTQNKQKTNENAESVKVATPVLKKQKNVLENDSKENKFNKIAKNADQESPIQDNIDEMPKSVKIIQSIHKNNNNKTFKIETADGRPLLFENTLPVEKRESIKEKNNKPFYKIETEDGQPLLIESTLPVQKREYDSSSKMESDTTTVEDESTSNIVSDVNREESSDSSVPILKGKVSKLANIFSSNEPELAPLPKKGINTNEIPKKNTILSKIAVFNKDKKNIQHENNSTIEPKDENIITSADNINKINKKEKYIGAEDDIVDSNESYKTKSSTNATKSFDIAESKDDLDIQNDLDRPKIYHRTKSQPLDIPNKFKIHLVTTTPPNTPQISFNPNHTEDKNKETLERFKNASNKLSSTANFENNEETNEDAGHEVDRKQNIEQNVEDDKFLKFDNDTKIENKQQVQDHLKNNNESKISNKNIDDKIADEIVFDQDFQIPNQRVEFDDTDDLKDKNKTYEPPQPSFEAGNAELTEDYDLTGKVSRIINRIDSIEDTVAAPPKKVIEVPIKKSVLSKIALFERQPSNSKPNYKIGPTKANMENTKPRIIEEVLKAPQPRAPRPITNQKDAIPADTDNQNHQEDFEQKDVITNDDKNNAITVNIAQETKHYEVKVFDLDSVCESMVRDNDFHKDIKDRYENIEINVDIREETSHNLDNKTSKETMKEREENTMFKKTREMPATAIEDRLKRIQSISEESNLRKTKSVADIDLGNYVKGKVHQLIKRMTSMEKLHLEKKNSREEAGTIIRAKERPKKKSVFEKIALFEQKSTAIGLEMAPVVTSHTDTTLPHETTPILNSTPPDPTVPTTPIDPALEPSELTDSAIYRERIEALKHAKSKYTNFKKITMDYIELNNGQKIPVIFLGTAMLDQVLLPHVVDAAIELGYRGFDTAFIYGNEKAVGEAIRAKIDDGTVQREDLFIVGKLWSHAHRTDLVEGACRASLKALGLEYFDLYLVHNPMSYKEGADPLPKIANALQYSDEADYLDAWFGMEELVSKGLAKSIGVSNFNSEQIARVVEKGKIKPAVNQVECHPYLTQQRLDSFCSERNITLMCFGALGSAGTPVEYRDYTEPVIRDPVVKELAGELNITPAQLLLRFQIESGHPVVTKCSSAAHLWENLQVLQLRLKDSTMAALYSLNKNKRTYALKGMGDTHRNYPFKANF